MRIARSFFVSCLLGLSFHAPARADEPMQLRVAVLDDAPPIGYRDAEGRLAGFNLALMQAACCEMNARCEFVGAKLEHLIEDLAAGHYDVAAVGLLNTPARRQKVLFSQTVYRSQTLVFTRPGIKLGQRGTRVSAFKGSAQERYLRDKGWELIGAQTDEDILEQLRVGLAQACVVPMMTGLSLRTHEVFLRLGLESGVLNAKELDGEAQYAIAPQRAEIKPALDRALESIKRNGAFDRINSRFLPFRVD